MNDNDSVILPTGSQPADPPQADTDRRPLAAGVQSPVERTETGFYEAYAGFARVLRTWLVAYGIGAPVLFLTQATVIDALRSAHVAREAAVTFLLGVAIQVFGAVLHKSAMWYLYLGELSEDDKKSTFYKLCERISVAYWFELLIDLGSIALFGWATWQVVVVLT